MKNIILALFAFTLITGCSSSSNAPSPEQLKIQQLQNENNSLRDQLKQLMDRPNHVQELANLREALNLSFRLIYAMEHDDYKYLKSVSSSNVTLVEGKDMVILKKTYPNKPNKLKFLKSIDLNELEYRGFYQEDKDHFHLTLAEVNADHPTEILIDFVHSGDGYWLYNGHWLD